MTVLQSSCRQQDISQSITGIAMETTKVVGSAGSDEMVNMEWTVSADLI